MSSRSLLSLGKLRLKRGYLGFKRLHLALYRCFIAAASVRGNTVELTLQGLNLLFYALYRIG